MMPTERKLLRFAEAAEAYYHSGNDLFHRNLKGDVRRNRYPEGIKEFIQYVIPDYSCTGKSVLFPEKPYPADIMVISDSNSMVLKTGKACICILQLLKARSRTIAGTACMIRKIRDRDVMKQRNGFLRKTGQQHGDSPGTTLKKIQWF